MNKDLLYKKETVYKKLGKDVTKAAFDYCEGYKSFLDSSKTEREAVNTAVAMLSANGYKEYTLGDKVSVGSPLAILMKSKDPDGLERCAADLLKAFTISPAPSECGPLIIERIGC